MLSSVQSVNYRSFVNQCQPNKPSFKGLDSQMDYDSSRKEWQDISDEFSGLENDENLPKPVRKFSKFLKVVSSGVLTGLGVVWASKKAGVLAKSAATSSFANGLKDKLVKAFNFVKKPVMKVLKWIKDLVVKGFNKIKDKGLVKKIVDKFNKVKNGVGGGVVGAVSSTMGKVVERVKNVWSGFKGKVTFDGANNAVANTLGIGSGAATAYEVARNGRGQ